MFAPSSALWDVWMTLDGLLPTEFDRGVLERRQGRTIRIALSTVRYHAPDNRSHCSASRTSSGFQKNSNESVDRCFSEVTPCSPLFVNTVDVIRTGVKTVDVMRTVSWRTFRRRLRFWEWLRMGWDNYDLEKGLSWSKTPLVVVVGNLAIVRSVYRWTKTSQKMSSLYLTSIQICP